MDIAVIPLPLLYQSVLSLVCSSCVRNHISYSQQHRSEVSCPGCRQPAHEGDIRKDLTLAWAVEEYKALRPRLIDRVSDQSLAVVPPQENKVIQEEVKKEIKVPPILHKATVTASRLREMLKGWGLPIDGNKETLWTRYRAFRIFVCTENDKGSQLTQHQIVQKFIENSKPTQKQDQGYFLRSINGDENFRIEEKSFEDLIREIKERKST